MAKIEYWYKQDLKKPVKPQTYNGSVFTLDNVGSLVGVEVYSDGEPVTLTGTVNGYVILPDEKTTVPVSGTRSENKAYIALPQSALAYPGFIKITIKLTNSSEITTLLKVVAIVEKSRTDTVITPSSQIITDWSQQIAAEMQAVEDASAAQDAKITDLKSATDQLYDGFCDEYIAHQWSLEWKQGNIASNGTNSSSTASNHTKRVRTETYHQVQGDGFVRVTIPNGYRMVIYVYSGGSANSFVYSIGWLGEGTHTKKIPKGYRVRFLLAKDPDATFAPENVPSGVSWYEYYVTDETLSMTGKPADASATITAINNAKNESLDATDTASAILQSSMAKSYDSFNAFPVVPYTEHIYGDINTGEIVINNVSDLYYLTAFIPVIPGTRLTFTPTLGSSRYCHVLYNANKEITGYVLSKNDNSTFMIPNGIYYVRLTGAIADKENQTLYIQYPADKIARIPNYVITEADDVSARVREIQNDKTLTMTGISDLHYWVDDTENSKQALQDMSNALKVIHEQLKVDIDVAFGDITARLAHTNTQDFDDGKLETVEATKLISDAFMDTKQIRLIGNHDTNSGEANKYFSMDNLYSFFGAYNDILTRPTENRNRSYGYMDDEYRKLRIICLNTSDFADDGHEYDPNGRPMPKGNTSYAVSSAQLQWLADKMIEVSDKEDGTNWQIVIMSHLPFDHSNLLNRTEYSKINRLFYYYENGGNYDDGTVVASFTGHNSAKVAVWIHGHAHAFTIGNLCYRNIAQGRYDTLKIPRIGIPNAENGQEMGGTSDYIIDSNGIPWGADEKYTKTPGTGESTSFAVNTIDPVAKVLFSHNYGAGIDRILHYEPKTVAGSEMLTPVYLTASTWGVIDSSVCTVSNGTVTAVAAGNTMVYCTDASGTREYWNIHVN